MEMFLRWVSGAFGPASHPDEGRVSEAKTNAPVLFNEQKNSAFSEVQRIRAMSSFPSYILSSIIHT